MQIRSTPWSRARLTDPEYKALHALTNVALLSLNAHSPNGPFTAIAACEHSMPECRGESYTPFRAALNALELHEKRGPLA